MSTGHDPGRLLGRAAAVLCMAVSCMTLGCRQAADLCFRHTVDMPGGIAVLAGLEQEVLVRRDSYGIPCIEAGTMNDLAYATGYVHASDRLTQMAGLRLLAQGRLSEMAGPATLGLDVFMRSLELTRHAAAMIAGLTPESLALLERYCMGVNAYLETHRHRLSPELALSGRTPEPWKPLDTALVFCVLDVALSFNLTEETAALGIMRKIGPQKTAWLVPVYPDEPIAHDEAAKLAGIDLRPAQIDVSRAVALRSILQDLGLAGIAASNNWAISGTRTSSGSSILCNDTHLVLSLPSVWNMMHLSCGGMNAAGFTIAGAPCIASGTNGSIAWGMTMVMADNQDIFLERLRHIDGKLHYLFRGAWLPAQERTETIAVRGSSPKTVTFYRTRHGVLLNDALKSDPLQSFVPPKTDTAYGLALSWAAPSHPDGTLEAFFELNRAASLDAAFPIMRRIRSIALNMVCADRDNIGWQVTGTYPVRAKGRGLLPSPGWTGEYEWVGFVDPSKLPWSRNPGEGFIVTANNKTTGLGYPYVLSSSWYWPERAERAASLAGGRADHTARSCMDMQLDVYSGFVPKLKEVYLRGPTAEAVLRHIDSWRDERARMRARTALSLLEAFDAEMRVDSPGAALVGAILHTATRTIFLDELGPEGSDAWKAFILLNNENYNATCDHLLIRDDSPFWDDVTTGRHETRTEILARILDESVAFAQASMGSDSTRWRWGMLHTYTWETEASKLSRHLGPVERTFMRVLGPYFNRGPDEAPGDHFTLNVAAYSMGEDFGVWLIPAMRMVVDFGRAEPLFAVNSTGQSDNPSSPHYDDAIGLWLAGRYLHPPIHEQGRGAYYTCVLVLKPPQTHAEPVGAETVESPGEFW